MADAPASVRRMLIPFFHITPLSRNARQTAQRTSLDDLRGILNGMTLEQVDVLSRHAHLLLNARSPLLKIPPEIRNAIYGEVIEQHLSTLDRLPPRCSPNEFHFIPPLFGVCQQVRVEGLSLLFTKFVRVARVILPPKRDIHSGQYRDYVHELTPAEAGGLSYIPAEKLQPRIHITPMNDMKWHLLVAAMSYDRHDICAVYRPNKPNRFNVFHFRKC